tara:strand:+ start:450 stop:1433 length:984 start_codon:yes stop_codon:yes gene_type:complete
MKVVQFAPEGFDYASNQITEGFHLLDGAGISFLSTNRVVHHGAKLEDLETIDDELALERAREWADVILCSTGGDYSFLQGASGECFKDPELARKLVFLDGHDSNAFLVDPDKVRLYLKRELRFPEANSLTWHNVRSFTFGVYQFHIDAMNDGITPHWDGRDLDVGFVAFGGSSPVRQQCADAIKTQFKNSMVMVAQDKQPLPLEEYWDAMRRCKVIVSVQGAGLDTLRFWEAMGFGAVLCSIDVPHAMVVRDAPEPMRHALYFDNFANMVELVRSVVSDPVRWGDMRSAADELIRCHHTTKARARQLLTLFKETSCPQNFSARFAKA